MVGHSFPDTGLVSNVARMLAMLLTPKDCAQPFPTVYREFHQHCWCINWALLCPYSQPAEVWWLGQRIWTSWPVVLVLKMIQKVLLL